MGIGVPAGTAAVPYICQTLYNSICTDSAALLSKGNDDTDERHRVNERERKCILVAVERITYRASADGINFGADVSMQR